MNIKSYLIPLAILFIGVLVQCGEDGPDITSSEDLLAGTTNTGKIWRITSIELEGLGTIDPFSCLEDNNITYFRGGRYEINEGTTKCDIDDPPGLLGSWDLDERQSTLTIFLPDSTVTWDVVQLRDNVHRISRLFDGGRRTYVLEPLY